MKELPELVLERIILAHRFAAPPGWVSEEYAQSRRHHGIVYVLNGRAQYCMGNGDSLCLKKGDCLYVPRGVEYITRCFQEEGFEHMTVNFDVSGAGYLAPGPIKIKISTQQRFDQIFSSLVHHWSVRHPYYHERCMGILYEMAYLLLCERQTPPRQHIQKLEPARAYLDAHFREDFSLELLPKLCGLSATYFRRLFHSVYHETPAEYRRRLRIALAGDLILYGQYDLAEVALMSGYPDPAYFSRVFKRTMGVSPSRYPATFGDSVGS